MLKYRILDIKYLLGHKIWLKLQGKINRNGIGVYYVKWSNNFGDLLSPIILKYYGYTPRFEYPQKASVVSIGTILSLINKDWNGVVLGCGWNKFEKAEFKNAKFWGVRGLLTKQFLGLKDDVTIGDPALLMPVLYPLTLNKKYLIGLIPHESEVNDSIVKNLLQLNPEIFLIKPNRNNPLDVIKDICSCQYILSSSLHGLIISDAYMIPNGRVKINELDKFDDFKFKDYYSSLGESLNTLKLLGNENASELISHTRIANKDTISKIQHELNRMFIKYQSSNI